MALVSSHLMFCQFFAITLYIAWRPMITLIELINWDQKSSLKTLAIGKLIHVLHSLLVALDEPVK